MKGLHQIKITKITNNIYIYTIMPIFVSLAIYELIAPADRNPMLTMSDFKTIWEIKKENETLIIKEKTIILHYSDELFLVYTISVLDM